jgi:protein-S-isoprenylcysteine O-methyltransferase Ste14
VPIVEDQTERGQTLVDTGLYAVVRHPLYLGMLPFMAGIALWLESYASVIAMPILIIVLVSRIVVEDKTLRLTLPGYNEYVKKVSTGLCCSSGSRAQQRADRYCKGDTV